MTSSSANVRQGLAGQALRWMDRLTEHGVIVAGPARPGPLGQASFYFNDPFGNHLELVTVGFVDSVLSVGVPDRSQLDYQWSGTSWDQHAHPAGTCPRCTSGPPARCE